MTRRGFLAGIGTLVGSVGLAQALTKQSALSFIGDSERLSYRPTTNPGDLYEITSMNIKNGVADIEARHVAVKDGISKYDGMRIKFSAEVSDSKPWRFGSVISVHTPDMLKRVGIPVAMSNPLISRAIVEDSGKAMVAHKPLSVVRGSISVWQERV